MIRIDAQGFTIGFYGVIIALKAFVIIPDGTPGIGIRRIDAQGLTMDEDGVIIALEFVVCDPEAGPGRGILRFAFRPLPAPIKQPLPVLHLFEGDRVLEPFSLTASPASQFTAWLDFSYPLHWHGEVQALSSFNVKGGQADQSAFPIE